MTRRRVFIDTWAWVAAAVRDDPNHARVRALDDDLLRSGAERVTSNFVLCETLTRLRYDASLSIALALVEVADALCEAGWLAVVVVDARLWSASLAWFRRFADQRFSFVDCTSFAIMAELGLHEALTADRHFATAGFVPLGV